MTPAKRKTTTAASSRDTLEQSIGKPRRDWSSADLVDLASDTGVRVISLMHVGGDGWLKTLDFVPHCVEHLRDVIEGGERADGSSLFPGAGIPSGASDIVLRPRPATAFMDPFAERSTLVLLCGHNGRDGRPLPESPDTILRAACRRLESELGIELTALGEVEYFLGKPYDQTDIYGADDRGYHAISPFVFGQALRRRAMSVLVDLGVPVKYGHSEVGYIETREADGTLWEQHEIELALQPLPEAAESILLTQWVLRRLARREGMQCNTDPMMLAGHAGNGLHVHLSVRSGGEHLEVRTDGELEQNARLLIGSLVSYGGSLMPFANRTEGSFERLLQAKEAPSAIRWGEYDRSALVRIPVVPLADNGRRVAHPTVEFRLPDGSALPHLLLAGIAQGMIAAGSDGQLETRLEATYAKAEAAPGIGIDPLPRNAREAGQALSRNRAALEAGDVFPPRLLDEWVLRLT